MNSSTGMTVAIASPWVGSDVQKVSLPFHAGNERAPQCGTPSGFRVPERLAFPGPAHLPSVAGERYPYRPSKHGPFGPVRAVCACRDGENRSRDLDNTNIQIKHSVSDVTGC